MSPFLPLKRTLCVCAVGLALVGSARAQTIQLRDGTSVPTLGLRRDGDTLSAKIKTSGETVGEVGYPLANVARVDFPEPALLKTAAELLDKSQADEAVRQLTPAVAYYLPFYNVPGNYWKPLALLQLDALTAARKDKGSRHHRRRTRPARRHRPGSGTDAQGARSGGGRAARRCAEGLEHSGTSRPR